MPRRSPESRPFPLHAAFRFRFRACAFQWLFLEVHLKLGKAGFRASVSPLALKKSTADLARRPCLICTEDVCALTAWATLSPWSTDHLTHLPRARFRRAWQARRSQDRPLTQSGSCKWRGIACESEDQICISVPPIPSVRSCRMQRAGPGKSRRVFVAWRRGFVSGGVPSAVGFWRSIQTARKQAFGCPYRR